MSDEKDLQLFRLEVFYSLWGDFRTEFIWLDSRQNLGSVFV